ncbi:MAG: DUF3137 domain-containing protein [Pseudomonadota bacterium]
MRDYGSDFQIVYRREIAPEAEALEQKRQKRVRAFYRNIALTVLGYALVFGGAYVFDLYRMYLDWLAFAGVVGLMIAFFAISRPGTQHRNDVKELVIPPICKMVGELEYQRKPKGRFRLEAFKDAGVVGSFSRSALEDLFTGRYRETGFSMVEARLKKRSSSGRNKSSRTVFKGLLFEIEVPTQFTCFAIMVGDKGAIGNAIVSFVRERFGGLERVETGHPNFEERYELFADDPAGALKLLSGGFLDTMVALSDAAGRDALNAAMSNQRFLLALPHRKSLFEVGRLHRPLDHLEEDLEEIVGEITIPHRVIDYLHGERPKLMP